MFAASYSRTDCGAKAGRRLTHARKTQTAEAAHDLNNMLTAISGFAELLRDGYATADDVVPEILRACEHAARLTRTMLRSGRTDPPAVTDLADLLRGDAAMLRAALGTAVKLCVIVGPGDHRVATDEIELERALLNLATNARAAMPAGGTFRVELSAGDDRVTLRCSDTGCGMDDATRARALQPYFTTKPRGEGTGLGLSQVDAAARAAGGAVAIDSAPGRGTTVELSFPRLTPPD